MYFISSLYQSLKGTTALAGLVGSLLAIVIGSTSTGGTVYIVGGSLCLANSLFNIIEIGKVNIDIKKQITQLSTLLTVFMEKNDELKNNETDLKKKLGEL